jgi:hypothetical protein
VVVDVLAGFFLIAEGSEGLPLPYKVGQECRVILIASMMTW